MHVRSADAPPSPSPSSHFLLPVAAIIIWVTEPSEDPIFPPSLIFGVSLVIGGILGGIGMLVAALNSDEAT